MTYRLTPRNCKEVKSIVEAETKKSAILYFAALYHLSTEDLLLIYKILQSLRIAFTNITISRTSTTPSLFISAATHQHWDDICIFQLAGWYNAHPGAVFTLPGLQVMTELSHSFCEGRLIAIQNSKIIINLKKSKLISS